MKKRSCRRFNIPGTTLFYKAKTSFFKKTQYSENYYPVINLSKGGAQFLCNERFKAGQQLEIRINFPGDEKALDVFANVRWISINREQSYQYQTGVAFNSYGDKKGENPKEILAALEQLELNFGETD